MDQSTSHFVKSSLAHFRLTLLIGMQVILQAFQTQKMKQKTEE